MSNVTLQDILTYYHENGYTDNEIADIAGVSQPTINRIRNGLVSGNSIIEDLTFLIMQYQEDTGDTFIHSNESLGIPTNDTFTEEAPITNLFAIINTVMFKSLMVLIYIIGIFYIIAISQKQNVAPIYKPISPKIASPEHFHESTQF